MNNANDESPNHSEPDKFRMGTNDIGKINGDSCIVCNSAFKLCDRNIGDLRSQHSETRLCDLIQRCLGTTRLHRNINDESNHLCICYDCINKFNEYDLACVTAERVGFELQQLLRQTDQLHEENDLTKSDKIQTRRNTMSDNSNDGCDNNDQGETIEYCESSVKIEDFETATLQTHDEDNENDDTFSDVDIDSKESIANEIEHVDDNAKAKRTYECDTCPEKFSLWKELRVYKEHSNEH